MKAAVDAAAVLYVAYRLPLAAEPCPYSPECVEGKFSEVLLEKLVRLGDTPGCLSGHHTCVSSRGTCHPTKRSADA